MFGQLHSYTWHKNCFSHGLLEVQKPCLQIKLSIMASLMIIGATAIVSIIDNQNTDAAAIVSIIDNQNTDAVICNSSNQNIDAVIWNSNNENIDAVIWSSSNQNIDAVISRVSDHNGIFLQ